MTIDLGPLTIKLDVLFAQLINMTILFYLFKKLFGETLIKEVAHRREQTKKLQLAQKEYDSMIQKANEEKEVILSEALQHKQNLITEGTLIAQKEKTKILSQAQKEAEMLLQNAHKQAADVTTELEHNWISGIKHTAGLLLKNIFKKDVSLQEEYIKTVLDEMQQKK